MRVRVGVLAMCFVVLIGAAMPAGASAVAVKHGKRLSARIFPSNAFTVRDKRQVTGRRVAFRRGRDFPMVKGSVRRRCTKATYSICDAFAQLNHLDGFDLQPRVAIPFTGPINLASITDKNVFIADGNAVKAEVVRVDAATGLALVRVKGLKLSSGTV